MSCLIFNQTINQSCRSTPGIKELYIANFSGVTITTDDGTIPTGVTNVVAGVPTGYSSGFWFKVDLNRESSSWTDELTVAVADGSYVYKPSVIFKLAGLSGANRTVFYELSQARVMVIVTGTDGVQYLLGRNNGLDLDTGMAQSGQAATDPKGLEVTLSGLEPDPFIQIDGYTVTTDLATV